MKVLVTGKKIIIYKIMRVLLQRVSRASVSVGQNIISSISKGVLVFVAFCDEDNEEDLIWSIKKIINLRVFDDEKKKMNYSLLDQNGEVLIVSQFTLFGKIKKGNRPSWNQAASSEKGEYLYNKFIKEFKLLYNSKKIRTGVFGASMKIALNNNGPVTIFFDSKN